MGKKMIVEIGSKFGMLEVIVELEKIILPSGQSNRLFLCKCECGNFTKVRLLHLIRNRTKSCGCLVGEKSGDSHKARLYRCWRSIINRCDKNYFQKHLYFDKGITMSDEWRKSYLSFKNWALNNGFKEKLTIDRIDNSKGYYPENCRWVTQSVNNNNRDNTFFIQYKNNTWPITELLRKLDKIEHLPAIVGRIKRGWNHDKAIDMPIKIGNYHH
jgi:hypothetical protein